MSIRKRMMRRRRRDYIVLGFRDKWLCLLMILRLIKKCLTFAVWLLIELMKSIITWDSQRWHKKLEIMISVLKCSSISKKSFIAKLERVRQIWTSWTKWLKLRLKSSRTSTTPTATKRLPMDLKSSSLRILIWNLSSKVSASRSWVSGNLNTMKQIRSSLKSRTTRKSLLIAMQLLRYVLKMH